MHCIISSPCGPLRIDASPEAITGIHFLNEDTLALSPTSPLLMNACAQLDAYFSGRLQRFTLPLAPQGTPFQQQVWRALQHIPWGEHRSYGDIAGAIGNPRAMRAVGAANGRNPIAIVIPCHRVIGANGSLTGYAGGLERKRWLLAHETNA
ncbi:methylated-DNA--[protein]-cysteine S-methyltransferase [Oceanimonas sp. CHS3-5]|uniref:methylated-DNA--[protein]-cysteine S-methyltransferase n=1 Tax=Oceanimonas sp. CHS3-5 TaxID=3068186 RepID=UPI00273E3CBC|nr:methylated-DNA--[protein]-cysteine S-methyltransferase [Oceanimonas sp. CHS3-5]MDP5293181.1 methylated-DNA--[protein]-cysteine S-methyltransferase [Oceanimonas sp. CHS3-5]